MVIPLESAGGPLAELTPTLTSGLTLIALRALGTADDAQEAVQETLARAVEAIQDGRVPPHVALPAFIYGIARHVIADTARRRRKESAYVDSSLTPLASSQPSPLESLIRQEELERVNWAIGRLTRDDRRLLSQCFAHGKSIKELAERAGLPPERLRKRKSRALKRLRMLLSGKFGHTSTSEPTS